jgi:hypothetical protein
MMAFCVKPTGSGHNKSPVPLCTNEALAADTLIASGLGKYKENRHRAVIHCSLKVAAGPKSKATTCFPLRMRDFRSKIHLGRQIRRIESWTSYDFWDAEEAIDSSVEKETEESVG